MAEISVTSAAASCAPPPDPVSRRFAAPSPFAASTIASWAGGCSCAGGVGQRRAGAGQPGAGHHRLGLRLAARESGAERHIGGALLMAGVNGPDGFGGLEQGIEEWIVVHAG